MQIVKARRSPLRWLMIALVFLATVVNYLDRQTPSVLAPILQDQFRMTFGGSYAGVAICRKCRRA